MNVTIYPPAAASHGCTATMTEHPKINFENAWVKPYSAEATERFFWHFKEWYVTYNFQDVSTEGQSGDGSFTDGSRVITPDTIGLFDVRRFEDWYDSSWAERPSYRVGWATITSVTARFELVVPQNGSLIYGRNDTLLHGANGTMLYMG